MSNINFLYIFNKILKFNENEIMIVFDINGNIWFKLKDLLKSIGYTSYTKQLNEFNINKKYIKIYTKIKVPHKTGVPSNFQLNTKFINESGLYQILSKSNKDIAKVFMNKYYEEIMPEIRKTGKYALDENNKKELDKINEKLINYKDELNYYYDKYEYIPSNNGYLYINMDIVIIKGIKTICYKIGYTKDMKKRIKEYKVGNFKYKLIAYIPINIDGKVLENCIKNINKVHILKNKTDTICYKSLKDLKNDILNCIDLIQKHICECSLCKKSYDMINIDKHKCYNTTKFINIEKELNKISNRKISNRKISNRKISNKKISNRKLSKKTLK
jgi:prophage antirepressor-like protein